MRFTTAAGRVWAVQMTMPFTFDGRGFLAGDWILGDERCWRTALTARDFKVKRAVLEVKPRRIA